MENFQKPKLPTPKIPDQYQKLRTPHFSTPSGMLLSHTLQPPPMYGLRGSTIPPKFMSKPPATFKQLAVEHTFNSSRQPVRNEREVSPSVFCDFCDRSFRDAEKLDKHKLQLHKELMGIKPRVYTAEEINEWKEARKKRYPTTQNVLARQQAQEERSKRGERLEESKARFGRKQDRRQPVQRREYKAEHKTEQNKCKKRFVPVITTTTTIKENQDEAESETLDGLPKFPGTSSLSNYQRTRILKQTNALSCLGSYGSGTESESEVDLKENETKSDDELPEETPIVKVDPFTDAEIASTLNHHPPPKEEPESGSSAKKRQRKRKHSKDETPAQTNVEPIKISKESPFTQPKTCPTPWFRRYRRYQNTMLEKLLEPEIRHERNVLLQCVRFVVQNDFFGVGSNKNE